MVKETIIVEISAKGTTNQTPFTPIILGNMNIPIKKNTNVLIKERIADIFPFEKAVNIPQPNILIPATKKAIEKIINPL